MLRNFFAVLLDPCSYCLEDVIKIADAAGKLTGESVFECFLNDEKMMNHV